MKSRNARGGLWRSRWAAIGAAVAVTFGAGGLVAVNAAGGEESTTVMIDPVRILDSRDPTNVGLAGPFVSQVPQKLQVTGSIATTTGTRTVVPPWSTGVLLNVTTVFSTANGFISIRPGDATGLPSTSSLNFKVGEVVPNAVQVALPTDGAYAGQIDITYDAYGTPGKTTDILIDVVGYTTGDLLDYLIWAMPFAVGARDDSEPIVFSAAKVVEVSLTAPFDGHVTVNTSTTASTTSSIPGGEGVMCSIPNAVGIDTDYLQQWQSAGAPYGQRGTLAGTRLFSIAAGQTRTFSLWCTGSGAISPDYPVVLTDSVITAIYTPAP